jgi:hypothetical protein
MVKSTLSQMGVAKRRWQQNARVVINSLYTVDKKGTPRYHPGIRDFCMHILAAHSLLTGPESDMPQAAADAHRYIALYDEWSHNKRAENLALVRYVERQMRDEEGERFYIRIDNNPVPAFSAADTPENDDDDEIQIIAEFPLPRPGGYVDPETRCLQMEERQVVDHFSEAGGWDDHYTEKVNENAPAGARIETDTIEIIVLDD